MIRQQRWPVLAGGEWGTNAATSLALKVSLSQIGKDGALDRIRTCDPLITNQVLYQLSYKGIA